MESSAWAGKKEKGDAFVTVRSNPGNGIDMEISSPVRGLFSRAQDEAVVKALEDLKAGDLVLNVEDFQALDFVLAARVKAAVLRFYRLKEGQ